MNENDDETLRAEVINYLNSLIAQSVSEDQEPRVMGGPYNLTAREMLREVERESDIGRDFVVAFTKVRNKFR